MTSKPSTTNCPKLSSGLALSKSIVQTSDSDFELCNLKNELISSNIRVFACENTSPYTADKLVDEFTIRQVTRKQVKSVQVNELLVRETNKKR